MPSDRVPTPLRKLLNLDASLTKSFCDGCEKAVPALTTTYKPYLTGLEISCHGIPWIVFTFISIYLLRSDGAREAQINLLLGLFYDIMLIAFIKSIARRHRPPTNKTKEMWFGVGPDKFSFPSGHASRAVWVALFFTRWVDAEMFILWKILLFSWAFAVCLSRVLLRRHYILDVVSGMALGVFEVLLSGLLWVGPDACKAIGDWIATTSEDDYQGP